MSEREKTLTINEIYHSIQGESTWVGWPCVFVRLTFCNLRCNYCDTEYAFYEGNKRSLVEILDTVAAHRCALVEITGGEPLLQKNVMPLMSMLCDADYTVLLETSGAHNISKVDPRVHRIMDLKTPGSGEVDKNLWSNIEQLTARDEVKFVMGSREDYEWSRDKIQRYDLPSRCRAVPLLPNFRQDRPAENRGMDSRRQTECPFPTTDAQIHLEANAAQRLIMRARLTKDFTFEAAQTLPKAPEGHKCRRVHGHSFKVEVSVEGDVDPAIGWVYDHANISGAMKPLLNPWTTRISTTSKDWRIRRSKTWPNGSGRN